MDQSDASVEVLAGLIVFIGIVCFCIGIAACRLWDDPQERFSMPPALWIVSVVISGIVTCLLVFPINELGDWSAGTGSTPGSGRTFLSRHG